MGSGASWPPASGSPSPWPSCWMPPPWPWASPAGSLLSGGQCHLLGVGWVPESHRWPASHSHDPPQDHMTEVDLETGPQPWEQPSGQHVEPCFLEAPPPCLRLNAGRWQPPWRMVHNWSGPWEGGGRTTSGGRSCTPVLPLPPPLPPQLAPQEYYECWRPDMENVKEDGKS